MAWKFHENITSRETNSPLHGWKQSFKKKDLNVIDMNDSN